MSAEIESGLTLSKEAVVNVQRLVKNCPQATDDELRKLLSIQGAVLNQIGLELIMSATKSKRRESLLQLGFSALKGSRDALSTAAKIKIEPKA